jgi:hypothetical protein
MSLNGDGQLACNLDYSNAFLQFQFDLSRAATSSILEVESILLIANKRVPRLIVKPGLLLMAQFFYLLTLPEAQMFEHCVRAGRRSVRGKECLGGRGAGYRPA